MLEPPHPLLTNYTMDETNDELEGFHIYNVHKRRKLDKNHDGEQGFCYITALNPFPHNDYTVR
jgi:hypothetical protein